jgi:thioesterase domain-containing protein
MQTEGSLPPLYLVHHLLGDILVYRGIADCFAPDRPVYGIQAPADFLTRSHPYPLTSLASEYVAEVLQQQSEGPFHLGGYSSGSLLAFEMARQLTAAGHQVGLLALIDGDVKSSALKVSFLSRCAKTFIRKLCKIVFKFSDEVSEGAWRFIAKRLGYLQFLWRVRKLEKAPASVHAKITLEQALQLSENAYQPQLFTGSAILFRFHDEAWRFGPNPLMGWAGLLENGLEAIDLPGGHITGMNSSRAAHLAGLLRRGMERFEQTSSNASSSVRVADA